MSKEELRYMNISTDFIFTLNKILNHLEETGDIARIGKIEIVYKGLQEDTFTGMKREVFELREYKE